MKSLKLSLAAAMAASVFAVGASASPLEEAIKDVDISGFAMYRYNAYNSKTAGATSHAAEHAFWSDINIRAAIDDNFYGILGFEYVSGDISGSHRGRGGITNVGANAGANPGYYYNYEQTFNVKQIALGYTAGNTTIIGGRQTMGTFFTDDSVATGLKILNTDVPGLTLAAIAFDNIEDNDEDMPSKYFSVDGSRANQNNLYGLAAIGAYDPVNFQLWYAMLENVANIGAADLGANFDLGGVKLGLQGQFAFSNFDSAWERTGAINETTAGLGNGATADDATFWALKASAEAFGFDASAGYLEFKTDKDKHSLISLEDSGKYIKAGQNLLAYRGGAGGFSYAGFQGENKYWFLTAGYTFLEKYRVGAEYVRGDQKTNSGVAGAADKKITSSETVLRASYQYSKKLGFSTFYSFIKHSGDTDFKRDDHFRFQAIYVF